MTMHGPRVRALGRRSLLTGLALVVGFAGAMVRAAAPVPRGPAKAGDGAAGGDDDATRPADPNDAPTPATGIVLRLKTVAPRASPWGEILTNIARRTKKQTGGRIAVELRWEQPSEAALVRQCLAGKTDGIAVSMGALAGVVPELDAFELPYLFATYAAADAGFAAALPLVTELLAAKGFVLALRGEDGFRHLGSKTAFLTKPEDVSGLVMRSQGSAVNKATWAALGATPKEIQVADVPESLASGGVAGYDNTLLFGRLAEWSRHVGYVTLTAHAYEGALVVWCKPWFDALPEDLRAVMAKADPKLEKKGLKLVRLFNDKLMPTQYEAEGTELRALTDDERAAFRARLASVTEAFEAQASPEGKRLLALLQRAGGR